MTAPVAAPLAYQVALSDHARSAEQRAAILAGELGETFRRKWRYYLLSCAGAFRARELQLWQWVLSKDGVRGGWRRPA